MRLISDWRRRIIYWHAKHIPAEEYRQRWKDLNKAQASAEGVIDMQPITRWQFSPSTTCVTINPVRTRGIIMKIGTMMFIALLAISGQSWAGYYVSANKLLSLCESDAVVDQNVCVGYILGVADAAQSLDSEINIRRYCLPKNVTSSQLEKVAIKYVNDNPQQLHKPASYYVLVSFRKTFPCEE